MWDGNFKKGTWFSKNLIRFSSVIPINYLTLFSDPLSALVHGCFVFSD